MRVESTRMRVKSTCMRVVKKQQQQQKAKHGTSACRSKVYVYYDNEFKVFFLMLVLELELRISGFHVLLLIYLAAV
jgi:hypothetical protein